MASVRCRRGYTMIDLVVLLLLIAAVMGTTAPLSRRVVANYQLSTAVQTLVSDLSQTKVRAIQSNAVVTLRRESSRDYRAAGYPRRLPGLVHFDASSADSVTYNGLGAVSGGAARQLVLVNAYGESRRVRIYAAGGHEVQKL